MCVPRQSGNSASRVGLSVNISVTKHGHGELDNAKGVAYPQMYYVGRKTKFSERNSTD